MNMPTTCANKQPTTCIKWVTTYRWALREKITSNKARTNVSKQSKSDMIRNNGSTNT